MRTSLRTSNLHSWCSNYYFSVNCTPWTRCCLKFTSCLTILKRSKGKSTVFYNPFPFTISNCTEYVVGCPMNIMKMYLWPSKILNQFFGIVFLRGNTCCSVFIEEFQRSTGNVKLKNILLKKSWLHTFSCIYDCLILSLWL